MITPLDIQNKVFSKSVRGYKEDEVDGFLDLITLDLEKLISENAALKTEVAGLSADLKKYKGSEGAVLETLEAAKALMGDISASAEKRAEILLQNAELDARLIQREAKESAERLAEESLQMKSRLIEFKSKYKSLLESELARFDTLSAEIFSEIEDFDSSEEKEKPVRKMNYNFGDGSETRVLDAEEIKEELNKTRINVKIKD